MATKTYGTQAEDYTPRDYLAEMQEIAGPGAPLAVQVSSDNKLIGASYETEWKEGSTTPVHNKKGEITRYKENYKSKKLTQDQVKKLDKYIDENLVTTE